MNQQAQTYKYPTKMIEVNPLNENLAIKFTEGDGFVHERIVNYKWFCHIDKIIKTLQLLQETLGLHIELISSQEWINPENPKDEFGLEKVSELRQHKEESRLSHLKKESNNV